MDPKLVKAMRSASRIVVFTGAGVSAESGIPTFRDKQTGLWEGFDAAELATPQAFERDPALVWGWYEWRRGLIMKGKPNPGHLAIADIQKQVPQFTLITQNVDDLHERAGSTDVIHLHGELSKPYCESCRKPYSHPGGIPDAQIAGGRLAPPRCLDCGARIRPGVVWFGESLPQLQWNAASEATQYCDFFICCGTSALVQPAASLTPIAINVGAITVQINPNPTGLDSKMIFCIRGISGIVLPQLVAESWARPSASSVLKF